MSYPYQNPQLPVEERVEDLLGRMSLEEKFTQMRLFRPKEDQVKQIPFDQALLEKNSHRLGTVYNGSRIPAENIRIIQDFVISHSRWGIPAAVHGESLHGAMADNGTCFPQCVGLGATFNTELLNEIVTQIGKECRANGVTMTYAPNVDLSRDPRWGRGQETFGEDPYLTGRMGAAYVRGMRGNGKSKYRKVDTILKHFAVHSGPEGKRHGFNAVVSEKDLRETYLWAFKYH